MQRSTGLPACASCKHQRKKCTDKCILAPFFPVEKNREFQAVHKIFGVSNVAKILRSHNSEEERKRAADSLIWEAFAWQRDPIQGPSGEFRRVVEELKFYKTQYQKITSQLPPTSQVTTSMGYKPAVNAAVASPVLVNGAWNNARNNNANINGGISTMMNNIRGLSSNGGGLSGVHDHPNGNSIIDHSSNPFAYGANSNHLVVQTMEHQNGSAAVILSQQHPNGNSNGVLQGFEHQNGTAAVMLPQQHHTISGFNQQYYIPTGQYNSSTDVNGKTAESSPWHGNS
ncbi:LOB domain-containing protein 2 [Coffea eugenioides]|uniref:LOB domain-containing protein 2 n=1 Tax=Coffea eugenioides TaxID=49369 RepID=UPI000F6100E6|nr:LOB domain-containing protein 2 [Coffea eugenioides]